MNISVECSAKINEFLAVGPRDDRGYHPIRSIFQEVALHDDLTISDETDKDEFVCGWDLPERNTVTKAWSLVKEFLFLPPLRITLTKRIPTESGLGGGSSDAAGLLKAVDRFASTRLSRHDKHEIAVAVGADVPFFLLGGRALAEGYGEKLTALPDLPTRWMVIAQPDVACATKEMYCKLDSVEPYAFVQPTVEPAVYNDFERVAPSECLVLIERLRSLGATASALTGSGSAVFGYFDSQAEAMAACAGLTDNGPHWVTVTSSRSRNGVTRGTTSS